MVSRQNDSWMLCIDQGGHASRAIVFDQRGELKAKHECAIATHTPTDDIVEHDPEELIESIFVSLRGVYAALGTDARRLSQAGLATQRSSIVCWDKKTGKALSPVISWADRRANNIVSQFESRRDWIYQKTGLYLNAHYGFSKIKWCLENLNQVRSAFQENRLVIGSLASFILHRILNERPLVVDPANGSRTLLLNIQSAKWDDELLKLFDIPNSILPAVVPNLFEYGRLSSEFGNVPLRISTGDQSAALFSGGWPKDDVLYINAGTGAFLQQIANSSEIESPLLKSLAYSNQQTRWYVKEGTVNGAGRALQWYSEKFSYQENDWSNVDYKEKPIPIFINGVSGLGSPFWLPSVTSRFVGQAEHRENLIAILESIVFLIQANVEYFRGVNALSLTGGLANIPIFPQNLADLSGLSVVLQSESEATALGLSKLLSKTPLPPIKSNPPSQLISPKSNPNLHDRYVQWRNYLNLESGTN